MFSTYLSFVDVLSYCGDAWRSELSEACLDGSIKTIEKDCAPYYRTVCVQSVRDYFIRTYGECPQGLNKNHQTPQKQDHQAEYILTELELLNRASREFWSTADKDDKNTQPTNPEVSGWLLLQGISSKEKADIGASIIRPDWAFKGRK